LPKETEEGVRDPAGAVPVPETLAVCGLLLSLSVTVSVALLAPVAAGEKVTLIVQLPLGAKLEPQLFVWPKSALFVPVNAILEMVNVEVAELESVKGWDALVVPTCWFPKEAEDGLRFTVNVVPVPVRLAVCGLFAALSVTVSVAVRVPAAVGVNVTLIVQAA
jgi:hypothetical protein